MIHPHTQIGYISDEVGFGVIATQFISGNNNLGA